MTFEPGHVTGGYQIDENVGTGVYTTEYRATDTRTREPVVLKVLGQRHLDVADRFTEVASAMCSVRSPDVAKILAVGKTESGQPFLVRTPHDRGTLYDRFRLGRPANDDDLRRIIRFLGGALTAVHGAGIVHGDLRPTNVLISSGVPEEGVEFGLLWEDDRLLLGDPAPSFPRQSPATAQSPAIAPSPAIARSELPSEAADIVAASQLVAEAALGRCLAEDETWSDTLVAISDSGRFELAAALGAARNFVDVARWCDVLSAPFAAPKRERRRRLPAGLPAALSTVSPAAQRIAVRAGVGLAVVIALGGVWFGQTGNTAPEAQAFAESPTPVPTATPAPTPTPEPRSDLGEADALMCVDQDSAVVASFGLVNVAHDEIEVEWEAADVAVAIDVNGTQLAQVDPGESGHTIQRLAPDTLYVIEAYLSEDSGTQGSGSDDSRVTSVVCAQTFERPAAPFDPSLAEPAAGAKVIVVD